MTEIQTERPGANQPIQPEADLSPHPQTQDGENLYAAQQEAMLHILFAAETDEELEKAREMARWVADLTPDELRAIVDSGDDEAQPREGEPLQHAAGHVPQGGAIQVNQVRVNKGGKFVSPHLLADYYADLFTKQADENKLNQQELAKALEELKPLGWTLNHDNEGFYWAAELSEAAMDAQLKPVRQIGTVGKAGEPDLNSKSVAELRDLLVKAGKSPAAAERRLPKEVRDGPWKALEPALKEVLIRGIRE